MFLVSRLTTTLSAGILALGITTTAPAPAAASDEAGHFLGGLLLGGLIGTAIAKDRHKGKGGRHVSRGPNYHGGRGHDRRVYLPAACRVYSGHRQGYSGRCLHGYDYSHRSLPAACAIRVGGHHGTIYRDQCLNHHGYY